MPVSSARPRSDVPPAGNASTRARLTSSIPSPSRSPCRRGFRAFPLERQAELGAGRLVAGIREAARLGRYLVVKRSLQIGRRRPREDRIVVVVAEAEIAVVAKQAAHLAGHVTMVDAERALILPADPTSAALARQERLVIFVRNAVALVSFRPPARVARVLVCRPPGATFRPRFLEKFRVFGASPSSPNVLGGNHACFPPSPLVKSPVKSLGKRPVRSGAAMDGGTAHRPEACRPRAGAHSGYGH
jgi:hypothetical protein